MQRTHNRIIIIITNFQTGIDDFARLIFVCIKIQSAITIKELGFLFSTQISLTQRWNECSSVENAGSGESQTMELMSARNFIVYDQKEEIIR